MNQKLVFVFAFFLTATSCSGIDRSPQSQAKNCQSELSSIESPIQVGDEFIFLRDMNLKPVSRNEKRKVVAASPDSRVALVTPSDTLSEMRRIKQGLRLKATQVIQEYSSVHLVSESGDFYALICGFGPDVVCLQRHVQDAVRQGKPVLQLVRTAETCK